MEGGAPGHGMPTHYALGAAHRGLGASHGVGGLGRGAELGAEALGVADGRGEDGGAGLCEARQLTQHGRPEGHRALRRARQWFFRGTLADSRHLLWHVWGRMGRHGERQVRVGKGSSKNSWMSMPGGGGGTLQQALSNKTARNPQPCAPSSWVLTSLLAQHCNGQ